jgi:hypothetical protein
MTGAPVPRVRRSVDSQLEVLVPTLTTLPEIDTLVSVLVRLALEARFLALDVQCLDQRFTLSHTHPHRTPIGTASSLTPELLNA